MRYIPNSRGVAAVLTSKEMVKFIGVQAKEGARYASAISPKDTGRYSRSITSSVKPHGGPSSDRAEGTVSTNVPYSFAVEKRHRVLRRTIERLEGHE